MTDTPPPLDPEPNQPSSQPAPAALQNRESGSGKKIAAGCGIGCLVVVVIGVGLSVWVFQAAKKALTESVEEFTSATAVEIEQPTVGEEQKERVAQRFDEFRESLGDGTAGDPLVLTESDLNALIQGHPAFSAISDSAMASIEDGKLTSAVSIGFDQFPIPIPMVGSMLAGRFFNGEITLDIQSTGTGPSIFIDDIWMGGKQLPEELRKSFQQQDLLKEMRSDPEMRKQIEKIEDIRIEGDRLIIVPALSPDVVEVRGGGSTAGDQIGNPDAISGVAVRVPSAILGVVRANTL